MPRLSDSSTAASGASTASMWSTLLMLVLPPLFWSGNFIVGRALRDLVPPMALSFDRWLIALLCLLPFTWHIVRRDARRYWQHRWLVLGVSLTGVAAFNVLVYWGLQSTSAANGMMLNSFIPLLIAGLGALFYRQRLSAVQWLGVLVSFTGVMVIVAHGSWTVLRALQFATGDAIVFVATICWAFFTLWLKQIPADIDRRGLLLVQIVITLVVLAPLVAWEHVAGHVTHWNADSLMGVLFVGIFPSVLAFALYSAGVVRVGAARAGLFIHLLPVFGALLSVLVLHEALHLYQGVGMVVIFLGVALANRQRA
jgi:drug/metabolite transporter (DMT)-like permease